MDQTAGNARLGDYLKDGDIRVLLMVLYHMTGDDRWLKPPYAPRRDVRLIPDPDAGLPPDIQDEIRAAIIQVFSQPDVQPAVPAPDDATLLKMMDATLGEQVSPEYAPLMQEEMGFVPRDVTWRTQPDAETLRRRHVLIVGAGVCGVALGVALGRLGIPYTVIDRNADIGGVWYMNRYPGCGVDTPNHSYSFSFGAAYPWSRYFVQRDELYDYITGIADEFGVRQHFRPRTELTGARWDEARHVWMATLRTPEGEETLETPYLVSAIGQLNDPSRPPFKGEEDFQGQILHSTAWSDDLDVAGKRVAIIGAGATTMQMAPSIADKVAALDIYQRTPQWVRPVKGYADPISDGAQWLLAHLPFYAKWFRFNMFWRYGDSLLPFLKIDPAWPHPERAVNKTNDRHRQELTDFIHAELAGRPDLIAKCTPDYPPYGKRILLDNGWYRMLTQPHVTLVTDAIDHFDATGVVTADGASRPADIIVASTGFRVTEMAAKLNITGRDGMALKSLWGEDNPSAYLGVSVPGFPNFFNMLGPNTGPGHGGSVIFQSECQSRYIASCIVQQTEAGATAAEVRQQAHDAHVQEVDDLHRGMIWSHQGMTTYYRNAAGRVVSVMPYRFVDYWRMTHDMDPAAYDFAVAGADLSASTNRPPMPMRRR